MPGIFWGVKFLAHVFFGVLNMKLCQNPPPPPLCMLQVHSLGNVLTDSDRELDLLERSMFK